MILRIRQEGIKSYLLFNSLNQMVLLQQQMKIVFLILLGLLSTVNTFVVKQENQGKKSPVLSNLQGFDNRVGQSFGDEKAATFLNLINKASTLYRDDMEKNLKYIQANMESVYGKPNQTFSVIIQSNSTPSITQSWVYNTWGDTYATYSTGVSLINPTWSYMCYILNDRNNYPHEYVPRAGQGAGITLATVSELKRLILEKEKKGKCTCRQSLDIRERMAQFDRQLWSALCHSQPISEGYLIVKDNQWISANPQSCYYMLFVIS